MNEFVLLFSLLCMQELPSLHENESSIGFGLMVLQLGIGLYTLHLFYVVMHEAIFAVIAFVWVFLKRNTVDKYLRKREGSHLDANSRKMRMDTSLHSTAFSHHSFVF